MNTANTNTQEYVIAQQTLQDLKHAVLIVSVLINVTVLVSWMAVTLA